MSYPINNNRQGPSILNQTVETSSTSISSSLFNKLMEIFNGLKEMFHRIGAGTSSAVSSSLPLESPAIRYASSVSDPLIANKAGNRLKECTNGNQLLSWMSEPAFRKVILDAIRENPTVFFGIGDAILQDNPDLFPSDKGIVAEQCRLLVDWVSPQIQEKKDLNFLKFFGRLYYCIESKDRPNPFVLPLDIHIHAEAIRKWMGEHQEILNGIEELNLRGAGLELIPPELFKLINLRDIMLSDNTLSMLPDAIGNLKKLKNLSLMNNQFTKFPEVILQLENLSCLNYRNNRLESIPELFATRLKSLCWIDFSHNRLSRLPEDVYALNGLYALRLNRNPDFNQSFPYHSINYVKDGQVVTVGQNKLHTGYSHVADIEIEGTPIARRITQQSPQARSF